MAAGDIRKLTYYMLTIASFGAVLFMFLIIADAVSKAPTGYAVANYVIGDQGSCENSCGSKSKTEGSNCYCDSKCVEYGDCCGNFLEYCTKK